MTNFNLNTINKSTRQLPAEHIIASVFGSWNYDEGWDG